MLVVLVVATSRIERSRGYVVCGGGGGALGIGVGVGVESGFFARATNYLLGDAAGGQLEVD